MYDLIYNNLNKKKQSYQNLHAYTCEKSYL